MRACKNCRHLEHDGQCMAQSKTPYPCKCTEFVPMDSTDKFNSGNQREEQRHHIELLAARTLNGSYEIEIIELKEELEATTHLLRVSEEINAGYEKDCAMGFALQRDAAIVERDQLQQMFDFQLETTRMAQERSLTALGRIDEVWEQLDRLPASLIYYPDALKFIGPWRDEIQEILRPNFKVNKEK